MSNQKWGLLTLKCPQMDPKAQNDKHFSWNFDIMHHQAQKSHLNGGFMGENTNLTRILGHCALKMEV